jgi:hypothetical protein
VGADVTDAELETQIEAAYQEGLAALAATEQRLAFTQMAELIKQRSPEQVAKMEEARGLRLR